MLSEDVNMYMYLATAKRYYALNDRTINLLMKGDIDMSATTGESGAGRSDGFSDAEVNKLSKTETKAEIFVVK